MYNVIPVLIIIILAACYFSAELNNSTGSKTFAKERAMKLKGYLNFRWL